MRILYVEDEPMIRGTIADELRDLGFEVIEAGTGDEALPLLADTAIDVLVTDVRMPGAIDGWTLTERCRETRPALPVIYATAYSDVEHRRVVRSIYLTKPFGASAIARAIETLTGVSAQA